MHVKSSFKNLGQNVRNSLTIKQHKDCKKAKKTPALITVDFLKIFHSPVFSNAIKATILSKKVFIFVNIWHCRTDAYQLISFSTTKAELWK